MAQGETIKVYLLIYPGRTACFIIYDSKWEVLCFGLLFRQIKQFYPKKYKCNAIYMWRANISYYQIVVTMKYTISIFLK